MANENNPAKYWTAAPNTVVAGPATGSTAGDLGARTLVEADIATALTSAAMVTGVASGYAIARGTASVTGNAAVNTGLTTLVSVALAIKGVLTSSAAAVSWSALASTGYFSAFVYANPVSSTEAPAQGTAATTVSWIAVGTI
jgi:Ni,Fe-hydrogenase I cytochrome b subunit